MTELTAEQKDVVQRLNNELKEAVEKFKRDATNQHAFAEMMFMVGRLAGAISVLQQIGDSEL